ncbi:MAG: response regulator transcription factor [Clostridiales bacterium]|nr:response regulator transcription factor [Clostridiales bacterium]
MYKILVREDDESIRQEVTALLETNGYAVVSDLPCDLALLDVNMPKENGFELCARLRKQTNIPVIFLTARDSAEDEIIGFGVGADDYIRKPYNSSVLLMRISRLLNRRTDNRTIEQRGLRLDIADMRVYFGGESVELTKNETRILAAMFKKPLITRDEIIDELWNNSLYIDESTLYVNINRLREKLKSIGAGEFIRTVRGVGYRL